jgi:hypothetical protein
MRHRLHMTVEETEAAAKAKYGADAYVARDIRALPLATAQLEDAVAGRTLINNIKDYGKSTGAEMVSRARSRPGLRRSGSRSITRRFGPGGRSLNSAPTAR